MQNSQSPNTGKASFYRWATALALITIFYNLVEGLVSVFFGIEDRTVALFGFGMDSFVEVISGAGIWHMIRRMRRNSSEDQGRFEGTALRITGTAFYILTIGLVFTALADIYKGRRPATTLWGIVVAAVSIVTMWMLIHYKVKIGKRFSSRALLADAACTKTCLYLSIVLLIASFGYEATGLGLMDSLGAIGIAIFSFQEGREAFRKARGELCCCGAQCSDLNKG
ncbi:MAG TPA: cation transporter [Thermodesulfovibrionales bacterium]|nr:cation transporter [Thermodesulfovibrionales bacterium]